MNVSFAGSWGLILLSVWLIVTGLLTALSVGHPVIHILLAILAVVTGFFILFGR